MKANVRIALAATVLTSGLVWSENEINQPGIAGPARPIVIDDRLDALDRGDQLRRLTDAQQSAVDRFNVATIIGGTRAEPDDYPWIVFLAYEGSPPRPFCSGVLVDARWVLTAAHCAEDSPEVVLLGGVDYETAAGVPHGVESIVAHGEFERGTAEHDIALIKLDRDTIVDTVDMASGVTFDVPPRKVTMVGWGVTDNAAEGVLFAVESDLVDAAECEAKYPEKLATTDVLCAGTELKTVCNGDSGGPLLIKFGDTDMTIGVASYSECRGPARFTRVSSYYPWITGVIGGSTRPSPPVFSNRSARYMRTSQL